MRKVRVRPLLLVLVFVLAFAGSLPDIAGDTTFVDATAEVFPDGLPYGHFLWGDCDGDGDEDLLVGGKRIFLNSGPPDFVFHEVEDTGDLADGAHQRAIWIDIDNDGDLDLFGIGTGDRERLFLNDGACRFTDISDFDGDGSSDLDDGSPSTTASCGDYDGDGFLDVYVGNYEKQCDSNICGDCRTDRLWHNLGNNTFEDVTLSSGIYEQEHGIGVNDVGTCLGSGGGQPCDSDDDCPSGTSCKIGTCARGSNWVDYDGDGDLDIFVSNYRLDPNLLWENQGDGTFTNVAFEKNVDGEEDSGAWGHVLGSDWGDYDNDGDLDLYTADLAHGIYYVLFHHDISQLLRSSGAPDYVFTDVRDSSGMREYDPNAQPDWAETCPTWGDYDNDGWLDIYVTHIYDSSDLNYSTLYHNDGDGTFTETTESVGANVKLYINYSAAWCDYDQDGDLDLVTYGAPTKDGAREAHLFRNETGNENRWLEVRVRGGAGRGGSTNRYGVGVRVTVTENGLTQLREVQGGHGYHTAMNSAPQEFGFGPGEDEPVDEVRVRWTDGTVDVFHDVPMRYRALVLEVGAKVHRGSDPSQELPVVDDAAKLFPWQDAVLGDGQTWFYEVEGVEEMLLLRKDSAAGTVVLYFP